MDLNAKLAACEEPESTIQNIPIRELLQPVKNIVVKNVPTCFNHSAILLELILANGENLILNI